MSYSKTEKNRLYARELRAWRIEHKICVICGKEKTYKNTRCCLVCLMDQRERERLRREKRRATETEEERDARNLKRRLANQAKKERNECLQCKKQRYKGYSYCYEHYIAHLIASRGYNRRVRFNYYSRQGLCRICGDVLTTKDNGQPSSFCEKHYREYKERAMQTTKKKLEEIAMKAPAMRQDLLTKTKYSGTERWANKVNKMSDRQIYAIWNRMNEAGELVYSIDGKEE